MKGKQIVSWKKQMTTDGEYKQPDWLQRGDFIFLGFIIKLRTEMNIFWVVNLLSYFRKVILAASVKQTVPGFSKTYFQMKRWLASLHFWSVVNVDLTQDQGIGRVRLCLWFCVTRVYWAAKKLLKFSGCETEVELILARSACFQTLANIQEMIIYPLHRGGIGWRRSVQRRLKEKWWPGPQLVSTHNGSNWRIK